jgi:cell division protein FtsB
MDYSVGELIDRLSVVNNKIWHCVEIVEDNSQLDTVIADAARKAQKLNRERTQLINEINHLLGFSREDIKI